MNNIKYLIFNRFKIISILTASMTFSIVLLMIRMKLTHSFFYLFLVWNLFLAVIPYTISTYLVSNPKLNKLGLIIWFSVWLLFLPNAPYIITDLIHLRINNTHYIWLDALIVSSFACNGLLLFYLSILDMKTILQSYIKKTALNYGLVIILFLSSFGIYLGRFLRYNSWGILSQPINLLKDVFEIIIHPNQHYSAWIFTIGFGFFLWIGFRVFKALNQTQ